MASASDPVQIEMSPMKSANARRSRRSPDLTPRKMSIAQSASVDASGSSELGLKTYAAGSKSRFTDGDYLTIAKLQTGAVDGRVHRGRARRDLDCGAGRIRRR